MLELRGVSKRYGDAQALAPTDLDIKPGKTTVLLGPSGCGKSTLLRLIVGLVASDTGAVMFGDQQLTRDNVHQLRHRMGYMIQDGGLFRHLTVRGNLTLLAKHLSWDQQRISARLSELLKLTDLPESALDRYPAQISGGQQQRVALMRALFLDPEIMLLDEPMGALDPLIRAGLQSELREIFRTLGKTVVMVTHDIGEAGYLGDTICLMKEGRIVQRGTLREMVHQPADPFVTEFINAQRGPLASLLEADA